MEKDWVEITEAAQYEGVGIRAIEKRIERGKYAPRHVLRVPGRGGKGGLKTKIHLDALSPEAREQHQASLNVPMPLPTQAAPDAYWLTVQEVAQLTGYSDTHVKRLYCRGGEHHQIDQAGRHRIHLSQLPARQRRQWYVQHGLQTPAGLIADLCDNLGAVPERDRQAAFRWVEHISRLEALVQTPAFRGKQQAAAETIALGQDYTAATLIKKARAYHRDGLKALLPTRREKGSRRKPMSDDAWQWMKAHYLTSPLPNKALTARLTIARGQAEGWTLPSERTLIRRLGELPLDLEVKHQHGPKAYANAVPSVLRAYEFDPMFAWVSDHHQCNLCVTSEKGTVLFPWLTAWMDMKSRKLMAWQVLIQPNSESIAYTYYLGCRRYGAPQHLLVDNGKDYTCYRLVGGKVKRRKSSLMNVEQRRVLRGAFEATGANVHFAIPYNAKSKPIERFFRTFNEQFVAQLPGYRGRNVTERPERLLKQIADHKLLRLNEFAALADRWIVETYQRQHHRGRGLNGRTPDQCFEADRLAPAYVPEENLRLLLLKFGRDRTVRKHGVEIFGQFYRLAPDLHAQYRGQKVWVRYDPDNLNEVYLYKTTTDTFIGAAPVQGLARFQDEEAIKANRRDIKQYNLAMRDYFGRQEQKLAASMSVAERVGLTPDAPKDPSTGSGRTTKRGADADLVRLVPKVANAIEPDNPSTGSGRTEPATVIEFPGMDDLTPPNCTLGQEPPEDPPPVRTDAWPDDIDLTPPSCALDVEDEPEADTTMRNYFERITQKKGYEP